MSNQRTSFGVGSVNQYSVPNPALFKELCDKHNLPVKNEETGEWGYRPFYQVKQDAIDEYRSKKLWLTTSMSELESKFGNSDSGEDYGLSQVEAMLSNAMDEMNPQPTTEERYQFNDTAVKIIELAYKEDVMSRNREGKYSKNINYRCVTPQTYILAQFCFFIRWTDAEHLLDESTQLYIDRVIGDASPKDDTEAARLLPYNPKDKEFGQPGKSATCQKWWYDREKLQAMKKSVVSGKKETVCAWFEDFIVGSSEELTEPAITSEEHYRLLLKDDLKEFINITDLEFAPTILLTEFQKTGKDHIVISDFISNFQSKLKKDEVIKDEEKLQLEMLRSLGVHAIQNNVKFQRFNNLQLAA